MRLAVALAVALVVLAGVLSTWRRRRRSGFALQQAPRLSVDRLGVTADVARRTRNAPLYLHSYYSRGGLA